MKGKSSSKGKRSLQKTASSVINIHTHRNSNISETLPFYFHDSVVSIRSTSLSKKNKNCQSFCQGLRKGRERTESKNRDTRNQQKELVQTKNKKKNKNYGKSRRPLYQLYSQENIVTKKPALSEEFTRLQKPTNQLELLQKLEVQSSKNNYLIYALKRTSSVLNSYRVYSEQLQLDCKKYKNKYAEALRKLKKYHPK